MSNQDNPNKNKKFVDSAMGAFTGAAVGASIVAAGAVILTDEQNRKKIKKVLLDAKKHSVEYVNDVKKKAFETKQEIENKAKKSLAATQAEIEKKNSEEELIKVEEAI